MSPLQKLTTEHTEYMKDKIIFSLCDLRGLCGVKITFLR